MRRSSALVGIVTLTLAACSGSGTEPGDLRLQILGHHATWEATRPARYTYVLRVSCFCPPEVVGPVRVEVSGDSVVSRTYVETGEPVPATWAHDFPDVDGLFGILDEALAKGADSLHVDWGEGGAPALISIDYNFRVADDEVSWVVVEPPVPSLDQRPDTVTTSPTPPRIGAASWSPCRRGR